MFEIRKDPTKVTILGSGDGWQLAPKESERIVYALNDYVYTERYQIKPDILFIMDVLDEKPLIVAGISNLGDVINRINKLGVTLVSPFKYVEIPKSVAFPVEDAVKKFGWPYFSNTISYMIAFALLNGAKEIDIYGVNQASSSEYFYEKSGVEYWLGVAIGMGVKVSINGDKSELLTNKARFGGGILYGYNQTFDDYVSAKEKFGEGVVRKLLGPKTPRKRIIKRQ